MKDTCFIIFNKDGIILKIYKNPPPVGRGEFYMQIDLDVPNSWFKENRLKASIKLPEKAFNDNEIISKIKDDFNTLVPFVNPHITLKWEPEGSKEKQLEQGGKEN